MAQAIKAVPSQNFLQKTLSAQLLQGVTASATLNNVTGIQNLPGVFIVDRVDTNGVETPNQRETIGFTAVSGSTLTTLSRGLAGSSDQDHAIGAIVEFAADVIWAQSIYDALSEMITPSTGLVDTTKVVTPSGTQVLLNKMASGATLSGPTFNFTSNATGSMYFEGNKTISRLELGATHSFLVATGSQPAWYYVSGASGSVLTNSGTGRPVYAPPGSSAVGTDGWTADTTWSYASASTITVPSGAASRYTLGDRIKWTQTTVKYGVIVGIADTTLTIAVNTDYVVANAAITDPYYSHQETPVGFPSTFAYTPALNNITLGDGTLVFTYSITGRKVMVRGRFVFGSTSSIGGALGFGLPVATAAAYTTSGNFYQPTVGIRDTGTTEFVGTGFFSSTTNFQIRVITTGSTYGQPSDTSSTVPMTWANTDECMIIIMYDF